MNKSFAVIDIGSLKAKFEIKSFDKFNNSKTIYKDVIRANLLKDLDKNGGFIIKQSILDTINAVENFKLKMKEFNVYNFESITTEAFRKAKNGTEVLERIEQESGIRLRIITGKEEGQLLFNSISPDFKDETIAVVDVGGGSVQVIIGRNNEIFNTYYFQTGTAVKYIIHKDSRHPTIEESNKSLDWIREQLKPLLDNKYEITYLIYGSTCVIDFFKAMDFPRVKIKNKTHKFYVDISSIRDLYYKLLPLSIEERFSFYPEDPYYMWGADKAFMNILTVSEYLNVDKIVPTNNNIATGILNELALNNTL